MELVGRREAVAVSEKVFRDWRPEQAWLLPPSPRDWVPEGHLVLFLLDAVRELDISSLTARYQHELRGYPPFHPRMMLTLLIYCYATGTFSSRRIMQRCEEDVACRVIVGEDVPDFHAISEFRRRHLAAFQTLFVEVLKLCAAAGLLKVGRLALDGTKIKANASRHKAMSYGRMKEEEQRLQQEIAALLAEAEASDQADDDRHGRERRGDELPQELQRRETRLAKIREAKAALEAEARAAAVAENAEREAAGKPPKPVDLDAVEPDPKAQRNFTDPESKIMRASNKGWDQCGNGQIVVTAEQIIVAADVTNQANDVRQLAPLMEQTEANLRAAEIAEKPQEVLADAGYFSEANVATLDLHEMEGFLATQRLKHHEQLPDVPEDELPDDLTPKQRMAHKLRTQRGRATYKKRKGMVEPVFGQIKQARGFRQFLMRGLQKMQGEWQLICLCHNLLKVWRSGWTSA